MKFIYNFSSNLPVQDAEKTLRSLKSSNQPMVKKRQLMQSAFGDYRKKMADEEKKLRAGKCDMPMSIHCSAFVYIVECWIPLPCVSSCHFQYTGNTSIQFVDGSSRDAKTSANKSHFVKKSFTTTFGNSDFRFNFPIDDMQKLSIEQQTKSTANGTRHYLPLFSRCTIAFIFDRVIYSLCPLPLEILDVLASDGPNDGSRTTGDGSVDDKANDKKCTQTPNECSDVDKLDASSIDQSNPFIKSKFHISDNSFKFNFSIECDWFCCFQSSYYQKMSMLKIKGRKRNQ